MENLQNEKNIKQLQDAFLKAALQKDGVFLAHNLQAYFTFVSPKAVVLNKQAFINDFALNPAVQLDIFECVEQEIHIVGMTAISSGIIHAKFKDKGLLKIRAIITFVIDQSGWQILSMQETYMV